MMMDNRCKSNNSASFKNDANFKCPYPKCNFKGMINMLSIHMNIHIQSKSQDAEEFRNQRRKRFPGHDRMLMKKSSLIEAWARGERAGLRLKPRVDTEGNTNVEVTETKQQFGKVCSRDRKFYRKKRDIPQINNEDLLLDSDDECKNGVQAFKGFQADIVPIGEDSGDDHQPDICISDDEDFECENVIQKNNLKNALTSLCDYHSDSDQDNTTQQANQAIISTSTLSKEDKSTCENGMEIPACNKNSSIGNQNSKVSTRESVKRKFTSQPGTFVSKSKKKKDTLLQKLLQPQITHERNVILQCVLHIVKNNFFES